MQIQYSCTHCYEKKLFFVILISLLLISCKDGKKVYICTGYSSRCYHNSENCIGLRKCGGDIEKISVVNAEKKGRRPCKMCCSD